MVHSTLFSQSNDSQLKFKFRNDSRKAETFRAYRTQRLQLNGARGDLGFFFFFMASGGGDRRPMDSAHASLARLLAATGPAGGMTGLANAAAAHHGGASAAAAAAPGVDPHPFGHGREAGETTTRVEADALYLVFNPTDFVKEWTVKEVGRVADALVGLSLPFDTGNIALTLTALDRAVFNAPAAMTPSIDLVAADVTQGNGGFAMVGDVNDSLDYHLWALSLSMGVRYKPRPMHTPSGYDVSSLYSLRQVGEIVAAPIGSHPATVTRYAQVKMLHLPMMHQMCEAFDITVPDGSDCQASIALAILEDRLSASTPASDTFWRALGVGAGRNARIPSACMAVVRGLSSHPVPPPHPTAPPMPAPAAAPTTAQTFDIMFSGFAGPELISAKALTLQILYPENVVFKNEPAVGAGAFDDVLKRWIAATPALAAALPSVPLICSGTLLRTIYAVHGTDDSGGGGGGSRSGSTAAGGGGGGDSSSDVGRLAAAIDSSKLPETKGEDGHARVVPLPKGMLPIAQAELLITKRPILDAAVALGQSAAGSSACANLGVTHDIVDPDTGMTTQKRLCDPLLNWALTQEISPSTTSGGSERALVVRQLNEAQSIVIDHVTGLIKEASDGGVAYGSYTPTPQMVQNMLKGMIVGSRPYVTRDRTTRRLHDYGMWMCVPMNVIRRPTTTLEFWEWYFAVGSWSDCSRQTTVAEEAITNWCKVQDALGEVFMSQYRADCLSYVKQWNKDSQLRLNDQNVLDLFMGGIYKLDKLNEDYQQSPKPSAKPRLSGVFRKDGSLVSPTILECINIGLIKLTVEPTLRSQTIFNDVPILFATYADAPRSSPSPGAGRDSRQGRGQLQLNLPPASGAVVHGTELQLGGIGRRSGGSVQPERDAKREQFDHSRGSVHLLPPPPRFGEVLPANELWTGEAIKAQNLMPLFKAEPLLAGTCMGLYLRQDGCTWDNCNFCMKSMRDASKTDPADLERALRRCCGTSSTRERTSTPGRGRSDSAGSASSVGSQNSTGGGHKPKKGRQ